MFIVENNEIFLYCILIIRIDLLYIYFNYYSKLVCMFNGWYINWSRLINFYFSLLFYWLRVNVGIFCNEMNVIMRKYFIIVY